MINIYNIIITTIFSIVLLDFVNNNNCIINTYIYNFKNIHYINTIEAIQELKLVDDMYQFNYMKQYIKFNLIYAYYKIEEISLVQNYINKFLLINQTNFNMDYILYLCGLIDMVSYNNKIWKIFFYFYCYYSNLEHARLALIYFYKIIFNYPNSNYIIDSIKLLVFIKKSIVKYEITIIKYYYNNCAYIAVFNRIEHLILEFKDTQYIENILKYREIVYRKLHINII